MKIKRQYIEGVLMLLLAVLLFWFPQHLKESGVANQRILVATDRLQGDFFEKTVLVILNHDGYGAVGYVVNRASSRIGALPIGGLVERDAVFTLHSAEVQSPETVVVKDMNLAWTKGAVFAQSLGQRLPLPKKYIIFHGYTGWGIQQLAREIRAGDWKVIPYDPELIFDTPIEDQWQIAIGRAAVD